MRISELARRTGVSVRMLRYYEKEGFLAPCRASSGYRVYSEGDELTVIRINLLRSAGLTLNVIRKILPCVRNTGPFFEPCDDLKRTLSEQLLQLDQRILTLTRSRAVLVSFLHGLDGDENSGDLAALQPRSETEAFRK